MLTTSFPALPPVGGFLTQQVLRTIPEGKYKTKSNPQIAPFSHQEFTDDDKHSEIIDTAKYRYSFMHNLCLEMLQLGFHMAFRELFKLVEEEKKAALSEDSFRKTDDTPIEEHQDKLSYLKEMLISAEISKRQGRSESVYDSQLSLAHFFTEHQDYRLADHFFTACHNTSRQVLGDGRRKEAEANCYLGNSAERRKDFSSARKYYEEFYLLTTKKAWKIDDGTLLQKHACDCLQRVYIQLSELLPEDQEEDVLNHLHKAHEIAKAGGDAIEIGKVGYLIGNKYDFYGKQKEAVEYHTEYLELCESFNDEIGMGKACQALAYANQRQGNLEEAVKNLKRFLQMSERSGDNDSRRAACSDLGWLYKSMGKYEQSSNYYKRAFELSNKTSNLQIINASSCEYAIALAHGLLTGEVEAITRNSKTSLESLLRWKSNRVQNFSRDQRTYSMFQTEQLQEDKENIFEESNDVETCSDNEAFGNSETTDISVSDTLEKNETEVF